MDTTITQVERMGTEATTNDNDAIDADMRAGDAELILRATQRRSAVMMVVCCSAVTAAVAAALITRHQWGASSLSLLWSSASGSNTRAPLARCRWLRPRHLAREVPRLCLMERVLPSPLTLLHLIPIDEALASSSMLRVVCVLRCCVHE